VLTRQGWLVALGAVALLAAGRLLGLVELYVLAAAALLLLAACVVYVAHARLDLEIGRAVQPPKVHAGSPSRVELTVNNLRATRTRVLRLHDPVSGTRGADLLLPPLHRRARATAAYRLPTDRRGILRIGPLRVVVSDPFGLVAASTKAAPATELTVYPHIDVIEPVPYTTGHDPLSGVKQPNALGRTGEDFYALRPYVVGDDLRRVHWPSSARHDELLVRQNELPWQGRTTVLLDVRRASHRGDSLEVAVSAAASVIAANWKRHDLVRLLTTDGVDLGFAPGYQHVEAIMEHLAVVQPTSGASLRAVISALNRSGNGGALVAFLAEVPEDEVRALQRLRTRFGSVTVVVVDRSAWDRAVPSPPPGDGTAVRITGDQPFASTWNAAIRASSTSRGAAARVLTAGSARQ
jgi:uncharacterized protein (DUF58 family)